MYIPHTVVHARRSGGKKLNPRQRRAAVLAATAAAVGAAVASAAAKKGFHADPLVLGLILAAGGVIAGVLIARSVGRQGRL